jgi:hypothetical protein
MKKFLGYFVSSVVAVTVCSGFSSSNPDVWAPIHDYIAEHSTYTTQGAEYQLFVESAVGMKTWQEFGAGRSVKSRFDCGLGWPSQGVIILLPTSEETAVLANMIEVARGTSAAK